MNSKFSYSVYIPSLHREVRFYELHNKEYFHVLKFIQNNDDEGLSDLLEHILRELVVEKGIIDQFTRVDKYCAIMYIIMICVGNQLEYTLVCDETKKEYSVAIIISSIIGMINELDYGNIEIEIGPGAHLIMSIPTSLSGPSENIMKSLHINDSVFDLTSMTSEQVDNIMDSIPYSTYASLHDTIAMIHRECNDIIFFEYKSPFSEESSSMFRFNIYNNTFFDFIKLLLRDDLLNYYKIYHALITRFNYDASYIESITPSELKTYLTLIREDNEERRKEIEKQAPPTPGPSMPVDPGVDNL